MHDSLFQSESNDSMNTQDLAIGSRFEHPIHGMATVTFVGTDYLGIAFDDHGEELMRRTTLESEKPAIAPSAAPDRLDLPWPESTFVPEGVNTEHFMGSHWDPFVADAAEIIGRLPAVIPDALLQTGYGEARKPNRTLPDDWPRGFQLVWPLRVQGLALILSPEPTNNIIVSMFPFSCTGSQQSLRLREITVWESGLEAQITAGWGDGEVTFFDTQYLINRAWYETGKQFEFILTGIAYDVRPAERREWTINQHPDVVAWMNERLKEGEEPHEATCAMTLDGAAMFLPVSGWDLDDYSVHAPVKSVTEFSDWLGQDGWRVRATVMRFGAEDADLDILITRRAWAGAAAPQVGQDIEGRVWLQGFLWMPKS
ncbi:hypothetical protein [uncultured Thiodictyon sp.]|jgi:hypothetical protein|uniref:hypothetical protein n=1 Tax=uncultured Thiodictyon sp. TaxID=1846217 RepID=UPI0026004D7F|nr:hypothetical protein [uncultured Thiodictyon sp.]